MASNAEPERRTPKGRMRREQLLRAALVVVGREGYSGATQRAIAAEAAVPPASTHYFFDSIDHLISEAAKLYLSERIAFYNEAIDQVTVDHLSVEQGCRRAAQLVCAVPVESRRAQFEIYLNAGRHPDVAAAVARAIIEIEQVIVRLLTALGVEHPDRRAASVLAITEGFALRSVAGLPTSVEEVGDALIAVVAIGDEQIDTPD